MLDAKKKLWKRKKISEKESGGMEEEKVKREKGMKGNKIIVEAYSHQFKLRLSKAGPPTVTQAALTKGCSWVHPL